MSTLAYSDLTTDQKRLFDEIEQDWTGADVRTLLVEADVPDADKAAVAEVYSGVPGIGAEFVR